jgi:lactonase
MTVLSYDYQTNCNPIPPSERDLQTVRAEYFKKVTNEIPTHLEGICFDQSGSTMYFNATMTGRVYKMDMDTKEIEIIWDDDTRRAYGLKRHPDGRLFVGCFPKTAPAGIVILSPEGEQLDFILEGKKIDDLAFANDGSFYASEFVGNVFDRKGAIYHVSADCKNVEKVVDGLAGPNGVALSPDGKILWITEYDGGQILRHTLGSDFTSVVYHTTGFHGPDSCEVDGDGNLYVALTFQGRILILNRDGFPIGQILMPKREQGRNLLGTHATVRPGTKEIYISCADDTTDEGSWIMKSEAFAGPDENAFCAKRL